MSGFQVKDSGEREEFDTGARRDTRERKGRYDLLSPVFLKRLALLYENGAEKYGDHNWEKGMPLSRYLDSAMRHLVCWMDGDRSEDHLVQSAWNAAAYVHTEQRIREGKLPLELDDINDIWLAVSRGLLTTHMINGKTYITQET